MKISVERSGGIAALTRVWTVNAQSSSARDQWKPIIEACPWDAVPRTASAAAREFAGAGQPDRFMYSIRAGQRRATLPERAVTGPWRTLVDSARAAAEAPDSALAPDQLPDPGVSGKPDQSADSGTE
ncbi:protealysin inhibitor emfourin [Pseudarthrobacter sp. NPDC058362]|uniref:protealysin inhibitor emfourin n=1 Tax=Pseudarthrobacter sp. NPDC058362 TaxID=3346458 RepID=UPI003657CACE